ncbi:hypothetical protein [Komagataeibacter melaceti]|uniref:hypothetical protein n=1 Tax=Komagataeibacter melaceti TaxID=2766577 RepID=UPI0011E5BFC3|nr:hypothetical protein [Komagataeibacter melaceti]
MPNIRQTPQRNMLADLFFPCVPPAEVVNPAGKRAIRHALQNNLMKKHKIVPKKQARSCDLSCWKDQKQTRYTKSLRFRTISQCCDSFQPPQKHKKYIQWVQSILKNPRECKRILEFLPRFDFSPYYINIFQTAFSGVRGAGGDPPSTTGGFLP